MNFKKPKPKVNSFPKEKTPIFPLGGEKEITGIFNGRTVIIPDIESMNYVYEAGNFGKGSLSKGKPNYHNKKDDIPKLMFQHQFENQTKYTTNTIHQQKCIEPVRNEIKLSLESTENFLRSSFDGDVQGSWKTWKENHQPKTEKTDKELDILKRESDLLEIKTDGSEYKDENLINLVNEILDIRQIRKPDIQKLDAEEVIVLDTSCNSDPKDLSSSSIHIQLRSLPFGLKENLNLFLEESFFLKSVLKCLNIVDLNFSEMGTPELWEKFNAVNKSFTERYITYHYYRAKGWVVKSGLKFGGDYLLYKDGPAYYHASYLIKVLDKNKSKKITWREFLAMNRLVETFNKDLVLTNILPNSTSESGTFPGVLSSHSVQEVFVKRWFPSKERFSKEGRSCS